VTEDFVREGSKVRKQQLIGWSLVMLLAGCAAPSQFGSTQLSEQARQAQLAAVLKGPQEPSLTQRIKSKIPGYAKQPSNPYQPSPAVVAARQKLDPTAPGFDSGPPNAELYLSMAKMSDRGGNADHARGLYQRALAIEPNHLESLLGLARLEDRQGNLNEAIAVYQRAAAAHPQNAPALNDLALCYARNGRLQESLNLLQVATRLQPTNPLYRNNIAKVLVEMNQIDEGLLQLGVVHPAAVVQYNMGVLLVQRGRPGEAIPYLTAATQIDPSLQSAATLLAEVSTKASSLASREPASNDYVLPTPTNLASGQQYPQTQTPQAMPRYQSVPAETAQLPVGHSPVLLPAVR